MYTAPGFWQALIHCSSVVLKQTLLPPLLLGSLIPGCTHTTVPLVSLTHLNQCKPHHSRFSLPPTVPYIHQCTSKLPPSPSWLLWMNVGRLGVVRSLWLFQQVILEQKRDFLLGSLSLGIGQWKRDKGFFYCFPLVLVSGGDAWNEWTQFSPMCLTINGDFTEIPTTRCLFLSCQ